MRKNQLIVAVIISSFAVCSTASFAAGTMKLEDLTKEQRMDMRSRADQLTADRAADGGQSKMTVEHATKVKKPAAVKADTRS